MIRGYTENVLRKCAALDKESAQIEEDILKLGSERLSEL